MPSFVCAALCEKVFRDEINGDPAFIGIKTSLATNVLPKRLPQLIVAMVLETARIDGETFSVQMVLLNPDGSENEKVQTKIKEHHTLFANIYFDIKGMKVSDFGRHTIRIDIKSGRTRWKTLTALPLYIEKVEEKKKS